MHDETCEGSCEHLAAALTTAAQQADLLDPAQPNFLLSLEEAFLRVHEHTAKFLPEEPTAAVLALQALWYYLEPRKGKRTLINGESAILNALLCGFGIAMQTTHGNMPQALALCQEHGYRVPLH